MDTVARVKCDIAQKGGISVNTTSEDRRQNDIEIIDDILEIKGENLIIKRFEKEELLVEGSICSITFRGNYV